MSLQQHFLQRLEAHRALFDTHSLKGRTVVDFGMGHGELTQVALDAGASQVIGFEIDATLPGIIDARLEIHIEDFTTLAAEAKVPYGATVVAAPPYNTLPYLHGLFKRRQITAVVLMVPSDEGVPPGFGLWAVLQGGAFNPPAKGEHLVVYKGL